MESNQPLDRDFSLIESFPLFGDERMSLSELDAKSRQGYSLGHTVAVMHSFGMAHGDLHKEHAFFNPNSGHTVLIDFDATQKIPLEPKAVLVDLLVPYLSFEREYYLSFLAGYVWNAYQIIEPKRPGFVGELLDFVGGRFTRLPQPPPISVEIEDLFALTGAKIEEKDSLLLTVPTVASTAALWEDNPVECMLVCLGLLGGGVDPSPLLGPSYSGSDVFHELQSRCRNALRDGQHLDASAQGAFSLVLTLLEKASRNDMHLQPDMLLLKSMGEVIGDQDSHSAAMVVDAIIGVLHHMAKCTKSMTRRVNCAQMSQLLFRYSIENLVEAERRYASVLAADRALGLADVATGDQSDDDMWATKLTYGTSVCAAMLRMFSQSLDSRGVNTGLFWSMLYQSRQVARGALSKISARLSAAPLEKFENDVVRSATIAYAIQLQEGIRLQMLGMIPDYLGDMHLFKEVQGKPEDVYEGALMEEFKWLTDIANASQKSELASPAGIKLLKNGVDAYNHRQLV